MAEEFLLVPLDRPRKRSRSARLATRRGCHAAAIVPDLQLTRDAARRVCASLAPAHRILIPLRPLAGHSQLVSLSLPSRISVYPAFFRPRSRSYPAPLVLARRLPSLSAISIRSFPPLAAPSPLSHSLAHPLIPAPTLTRELLSLLCSPLSLYLSSDSLTITVFPSLPPSFPRAACRRHPFLLSPFRARRKRSRSHPSFGFLSIPPIQLTPPPSPSLLPPSSVAPVYLSSIPYRESHPPSPPHI